MNDGLDLLNAYLNGQELTEDQCQALSDWVCASPRHAEVAAELTHLDATAGDIARNWAFGSLAGAGEDIVPSAEQILAEVIDQERAHQQAQRVEQERIAQLFESQGSGLAGQSPAEPEPAGPRVVVIPRVVAWGAIAAAVMLVFGLGWLVLRDRPTQPPMAESVSDQAPAAHVVAAYMRDQVDAQWASPRSAPGLDEPVGEHELELLSGLARFEMGRGAEVVIEGPARFRMAGPNQLKLTTGRLVAKVPEKAHGFQVQTPTATLVDLGTEFGVDTFQESGTFAQVYDGEITLAAARDGGEVGRPVSVRRDQAARVDPGADRVERARSDAKRFVRRQTFDALAGHLGPAAYADAVRLMWQRDPTVLAATSFVPGDKQGGYGWRHEPRPYLGQFSIADESLELPAVEDAVRAGGRMLLDGDTFTEIFLDVDTRPGSPLDRAGLLTPGGEQVGRDGTRVYLSWTICLEQGVPPEASWFGLSLFVGDGEQGLHEQLSLGQNFKSRRHWGMVDWNDKNQRGRASAPMHLRSDGRPIPVERGRVYRWLLVIDYDDQGDRVSIYLDPDPAQPQAPNLQVDVLDAGFDRIRIGGELEGCVWSVDELRIGTTIESVLKK